MTAPRRVVSPATDAVAALLDELVRLGLEHVVVCPGSRSQALALTAAALDRAERVHLHVRIDERVAGFLALGLARETRTPVAVIVTSGTAVANLLPAVMEAHHAGVPLLLLTADRPAELRGVGANQATHQPDIFREFTRLAVDAPVPTEPDEDGTAVAPRQLARNAWDAATGDVPGPVHLNLPLREPLAGDLPSFVADAAGVATAAAQATAVSGAHAPDMARTSWPSAHTIVIAGADAGALAVETAERLRLPLVAEIVSNARFGTTLVPNYREALRSDRLGGAVERAIVLGHPTLTREVSRLLTRRDVAVFAVRSGAELINLNGATTELTVAELDGIDVPLDEQWLASWLTTTPDATPDGPPTSTITREELVRAVWEATESIDRLMFGSSRLVRTADTVLAPRDIRVHANRGLAGIDGTIATATGIALAARNTDARSVTRVLLGDLTFLHDVGALLLPPDEVEPRIQVIVGNDGGGTIFDGLEVADVASDADFRRVQYTPHDARIDHLALAYGWEYTRASSAASLAKVLATPVGGRQIIEVRLPR